MDCAVIRCYVNETGTVLNNMKEVISMKGEIAHDGRDGVFV